METREILLKADKVNVAFERLDGGKIRVGTSSWDNYISIYYLPSGSYGGAGNGLTNVTYDSAYGDLFVPHYGGDNTVWPVLAAVPGEASGTTRYIFPAWQSLADNGESFGGQIAIFEALQRRTSAEFSWYSKS
jgi:hypothetical protein